MTPATQAISAAREDLAGDAARRATQARKAAADCTGDDHDYCIKRAEWFETAADRLRDAQRGDRG